MLYLVAFGQLVGNSNMNNHSDKSLWPATCHGRWMSDEYEPGLISVIIPTYNRAQFLMEALNSVWYQTYRPIELIVVDDGSTDNTREAVLDWGQICTKDIQFKLQYFYQENKGAPAARNLGLIKSRGEYIQFLDSDDLLHPEKFQRQIGILDQEKVIGFVYSGTVVFSSVPDWNAKPYTGKPVSSLLPDFITQLLWNTIGGIYRRGSCYANGPWDESLEKAQDWEYNIRFSIKFPKVKCLPTSYSARRVHDRGRINDLAQTRRGVETLLHTVSQIDRVLQFSHSSSLWARDGLASWYSGIAFLAIANRCNDLALFAAQQGKLLKPSIRKRLQLNFISFLTYFSPDLSIVLHNLARRFFALTSRLGSLKK